MIAFRASARLFVLGAWCAVCGSAEAATIKVPGDQATIQAGIDAAEAGDVVLVGPGTYAERVRLKEGVTLKSEGGDEKGELGLKRAEATVIDGGGAGGKGPGVQMAEGATLDGFTVTRVGLYDDEEWKKHHATQGEEQSHEHIGHFGTPGVGVSGVNCTVTNNIVRHNGYTGIAIRGKEGGRCTPLVARNVCYRNMGGGIGSVEGSTAVIEGNVCFENFFAGIGHDNASPLVVGNECYGNVRAGIGISEGAKPTVRGNRCYHNRRAGIGIRTGAETSPLVVDNDCYENDMAGIGNRDEATPIIRGNRCWKNKMAGIGSRDGARAVIEGNECYENEMAGIGSRLNAAPVIRGNRCYKNQMAGIGSREGAEPVIEGNECYENGMAGIGSREGAAPIIRGNRCYKNKMAGIGSRLAAKPTIVDNECFENGMAGIGSREGAAPVIRGNRCFKNRFAGIGSREGARPLIVENEARENQMAGIGVRGTETVAIVVGNRCLENRLVALGLPDGATGFLHGNHFERTGGGAPPLVAIKGGSTATVSANEIRGGGVAGLLVQGPVLAVGNRFRGRGPDAQGSAIWVWDGSVLAASDNGVQGYRNAINASGSRVLATGNVVSDFRGPAIVVRKPTEAARVYGNTVFSKEAGDTAAQIDGEETSAADNVVKDPAGAEEALQAAARRWPAPGKKRAEGQVETPAPERAEVRDGRWKLVVTRGKTTRYELYDVESDPEEKTDLAEKLEQIVFRLRGRLERQETESFRPAPGQPGPRR